MHILASEPSITHLGYSANLRNVHPQLVNEPTPEDRVTISAEAQRLLHTPEAEGQEEAAARTEPSERPKTPDIAQELEPREQRVVEDLRQRDQEVRRHELAHLLAAGPYARGGPRFTYTTGPDGQRYAVGGEVPVDTSPVPGDPRATLQKAIKIRQAALAPAHPSGADLTIASKATTMAAQAQQEQHKMRAESRLTTQPTTSSRPMSQGEAGSTRSVTSNSPAPLGTTSPPADTSTSAVPPSSTVATALHNYQRAVRIEPTHHVTV